MAEEILIGVRLDRQEGEREIDSLTQSIVELNKANKELTESNKTLAKTGQENSKEYKDNARQIEINKQKITENTASRKGLVQAIVAEEGSLKQLRIQNAEMIKQRDQISTKTEVGRKKIADLNAQIDKNNVTIRENSSALEKQKINIGNYASALDGIVPGLGGMVQGIQASTAAGKAFIATPLGAVLGAIGLALGALTAYFKGSEEGQNRFNRAVQIGGQVLEVFMDLVEEVGGLIFDTLGSAFTFIGDLADKAANALGINTAALKVYVGEILKTADSIATTQENINALERQLITDRAKTNAEVARLRREADETEGKARIDKINQAIALEEGLLAKEKALAEERLKLAQIEAEQDPTIENKKAEAEATAALINLDAQFLQETRKNNKERLKLEEEYRTELQAVRDNADALERTKKFEHEKLISEGVKQIEIDTANNKISLDTLTAQSQAKVDQLNAEGAKKAAGIRIQEDKAVNESILASAGALSAGIQAIATQDSLFAKTVALVQIGINSAIGVARAVAAGAGLIFPANLGAIASGVAAVLTGIGQAKRLLGFITGGLIPGFATGGGISGTKIMPHHGIPITRSNGDNRLITAKIGETVVNEHQKQLLGGDRAFAEAGIPGFARGGQIGGNLGSISRGISLSEINAIVVATMQNMPPIQVAVEDINKAQAARAQVTEISTLR